MYVVVNTLHNGDNMDYDNDNNSNSNNNNNAILYHFYADKTAIMSITWTDAEGTDN
jgi:hypothetical protein